MVQEILAAIKLVAAIIDGAKAIMALINANKDEKWFQESAKAFTEFRDKLNNAQSKEEKDDAAKKMARDLAQLWRDA